MLKIGPNLRLLRKARHLTQEELGRIIGISNVMISSYELSTRQPTYEILVRLANFFGVSSDYLLGINQNLTVSLDSLSQRHVKLVISIVEQLKD